MLHTENSAAGGDASPLVSKKQIAQRLGVSERTAAAITGEAYFPQPIVIAPRVLRWRWAEIETALATKAPRRAVLTEPGELKRAREQRTAALPA